MRLFTEVVDNQASSASDILSRDDQVDTTIEVACDAHSVLDGLIVEALRTGGVRIDCKSGCSWCCYYQVDALAPEIIAIAAYVREQFTTEGFNALKLRISESVNAAIGRTPLEYRALGKPCPMLVNNRCSIYPVRPIACRGWNSRNARKCEAAHRKPIDRSVTIPIYGVINALADSVSCGLSKALNREGLESDPVNLTAALNLALNNPDVAVLWRFRERPFAAAKSSPISRIETDD